MILSFNPQFKQKILDGTKVHTIRADKKKRWKVGSKIHFATGMRTKHYNQFDQGVVLRVWDIKIFPSIQTIYLDNGKKVLRIHDAKAVAEFALNDGFDTAEEFWQWFNKPFEGRLIIWGFGWEDYMK